VQVKLDAHQGSFQPGAIDTCVLPHRALGALQKCTLFHDSAGGNPDWAVRKVVVTMLRGGLPQAEPSTFWFCTTLKGQPHATVGRTALVCPDHSCASEGASAPPGQASMTGAPCLVQASAGVAVPGGAQPQLYTIIVHTSDIKGAVPGLKDAVKLLFGLD
jgi:PLAT/LH2 domain